MESIIDLGCQGPYSNATIIVSSDSQLMEYSLLYKRNDAIIEISMDLPMFGINQLEEGSDFWDFVSISPGQVIEVHGNEVGEINFYNRQGQVIKTEVINEIGGGINIPATAKQFSIADAGEYEFIVFQPSHPSSSISSPESILIGETLTINITSTQSHNLDQLMTTDRIHHMWDLEYPTIELNTTSIDTNMIPYSMVEDIQPGSLTFPSLSVDLTASIDFYPSDFGVGEHTITIEIESSWTGTHSHEVTFVVEHIQLDPLTGVDDLTATLQPDGRIQLDWGYGDESQIGPEDYLSLYMCSGIGCTLDMNNPFLSQMALGQQSYVILGEDGTTYTIRVQTENGNTDIATGAKLTGGYMDITVTADGSVSPPPTISNAEASIGSDSLTFNWDATNDDDVASWLLCWAGTQDIVENDFDILYGTSCVQTSDSTTSLTVLETTMCGAACNAKLYFGIAAMDEVGNLGNPGGLMVADMRGGIIDPEVIDDGPDDDDGDGPDDDTNQNSQSGNPSDGNDGGDSAESSEKSDSSDTQTMLIAIASVVGIILLLGIISLMVVRRKRGGDVSFNQQMPSMGQWDAPLPMQTAPLPGMVAAAPPIGATPPMVAPIPSQPPTTQPMMQQQVVPVSPEPVAPTRVNSYLELVGGGEYSTDERGTIYTDPTGYEWVQLADGSFVRMN